MIMLPYTVSILLMILVPIFLAVLLRRSRPVPWILFAFGTLTFIGSQVVHLPLNSLLTRLHILPDARLSDETISLLQTSLVLGLTAGLCEETARAVGYWLLKRYRRLEDSLMLGLGHGGIESMIFGGVLTAATISALVPMIGADLSKLGLLPEQRVLLEQQLLSLVDSPILSALAPLVERLLAMAIHVVLSFMVLQSFRRRNVFYYVAAVIYHMLFDAIAVYFSTNISNHFIILGLLALMLLPGLAWLILSWRAERPAAQAPVQNAGSELRIFFTALRKEILQQWHTRRFLVVMAVFVLFGLTSPLMARFMPEIIKSMPGAEQFAGLIPVPTTADAMTQYIKNLTQFGFVLAVLLGMSAVAGEKETGTAAIILSKPLPRWAFVLSKFTAQALVYAAAYLVAGLGAYYYTVILFGGIDMLTFLGINLLLLLWLLTFSGAALLGSVIGSTVAASAGIGLGISVAFLLAGSIPQYGSLLPNGLTAWASMLGSGAESAPANGGALAGGIVLIVLCLMWAVAVFENQEV